MRASGQRIIGALVLAAVIGAVGFVVGEYAPFTGGVASIAEPFSDVRDETALGYAVVGIIFGAIAGLATTGTKAVEGSSGENRRDNAASDGGDPLSRPMREERPCPQCAERILGQAKVCKHCGATVAPTSNTVASVETIPNADHPIEPVARTATNRRRTVSAIVLAGLAVFAAVGINAFRGGFGVSHAAGLPVRTLVGASSDRPTAQSPSPATPTITGDLTNGRFAKSIGTDTLAFIDGWFTILERGDSVTASPSDVQRGLEEAANRNEAQGIAGIVTTTQQAPFETVTPPSPNTDGTVTVARQGITKNPLCRVVQAAPDQWSCFVTGNSALAQILRAKGVVNVQFAKDADGYFIPAQPLTNMERIRLTPVR
jgi:hypothetical protein